MATQLYITSFFTKNTLFYATVGAYSTEQKNSNWHDTKPIKTSSKSTNPPIDTTE